MEAFLNPIPLTFFGISAISFTVAVYFHIRSLRYSHQAAIAHLEAEHARELAAVHRKHHDTLVELRDNFVHAFNAQSDQALDAPRSIQWPEEDKHAQAQP
ncbi:hypothetical protein NGM33_28570 [Nocardiopsis dassonvillei]|uniref:hypothetical protein n=1 Tax=Nocardiopsis dassonvillei TaxID=2014 RepID=UPI0020A29AF6|nr:hypothetical protein [Nocardiopsis dassonvillei]MCP3017291.1 hypothetical protein [Nocardiopsis dassonvillei]